MPADLTAAERAEFLRLRSDCEAYRGMRDATSDAIDEKLEALLDNATARMPMPGEDSTVILDLGEDVQREVTKLRFRLGAAEKNVDALRLRAEAAEKERDEQRRRGDDYRDAEEQAYMRGVLAAESQAGECCSDRKRAGRERDAALSAAEAFAERMEGVHSELDMMRDVCRAIESMVVARVGGEVEGAPTTRINYLQRIDALRDAEAKLLAETKSNTNARQQLGEARAEIERLRGVLAEIAKRPPSCPPDCGCNASRARAALAAGEGKEGT